VPPSPDVFDLRKRPDFRWWSQRLLWPTPERLHDEGWIDQMILYRHDGKIDQLASVIAAMNTGQGCDLLGVCELARLPRMS
jgi:hypothetical protein